MISLSFVKNDRNELILNNHAYVYESTVDELSNSIDNKIDIFLAKYESYMTEAEIMGELSEDKSLFLEAESSNLLTTIGNAVISMFKKLIEFANNVIDKMKNIGFKSKSDTDKLELLIKKHPELKNDIVTAFKNNDLRLSDMKSLKELNSAFDEIVNLSKKADVDPKSIKGKWEAAKKKYEENSDKIAKTAKNITAVVTAATVIVTFKKVILDSRKNVMDAKEKIGKNSDEVTKAIEDLKKFENGKYANANLTNAQLIKNATAFINGEYHKMIVGNETNIDKLSNTISHFLGKYSDDEMELRKDAVKFKDNKDKESKDKDLKDEVKKAKKIKGAQLAAQHSYDKAHEKENYAKAKETAKQQQLGREEANVDLSYDDNYLNSIRAKSYQQRAGSKEYDDDHTQDELEAMKKKFKTRKEFEQWRDKNYPKQNKNNKNTK